MEAMRLLVESGFDFLPDTDLQKQPIVRLGVHSQATKHSVLPSFDWTFACERFPHERWILAVQKSFLSKLLSVLLEANGMKYGRFSSLCVLLPSLLNLY